MEEPLSYIYPYPADVVMAMFRDRGYITKKHAQMRQRNIRILEAVDKPELYRLSIRRDLRALLPESLPDFAAAIVGRLSSIVTTIEWRQQYDDSFVGHNAIHIEGAPLEARIAYWLMPLGERCAHKQLLQVAVNVPLLGGKLERFVMDAMREIQRKDYEYNLRFLETFAEIEVPA